MFEATAGLSSVSGGASAGLPGRFSDNGSYREAMSGTGPANCRFMREARLSDKSREISVRTHSEAGIPRVSNRHCGNEVFLARNKILRIQNLAEKFISEQISARQLASFLGLLQTLQATLPAITLCHCSFEISRETFPRL